VHLLTILVVAATAWSCGGLARVFDERAGAWAGIGYAVFVHAYLRAPLAANTNFRISLSVAEHSRFPAR
jgi:hypothetical protein